MKCPLESIAFFWAVNYLEVSPQGIFWKQIFNFEASLGVLRPLAMPIKKLFSVIEKSFLKSIEEAN